MGVAFYVVLEDDDPGFDTFVDGKALAHESERLEPLTERLGLRPLLDFLSQDFRDVGGPIEEPSWFDPAEGLAWAEALRAHLRVHPGEVRDAEGVLRDLDACVAVFEEAVAAGLRWRFELDV